MKPWITSLRIIQHVCKICLESDSTVPASTWHLYNVAALESRLTLLMAKMRVNSTCSKRGALIFECYRPCKMTILSYIGYQNYWQVYSGRAIPSENVSLSICGQRRSRSACASTQSDQCLHYPLPKSFDAIECINGEERPGWNLTHAQNDVNLCLKALFSLDAAH